jgi:hypothetical protein
MNSKRKIVAQPDERGTEFKNASADLVRALRSFAAALGQSEVPDRARDLLPEVILYADRLDLKRVAIADACQVTEPTVSRWASGAVTPHILVAQAALRAVYKLALEKAERYEAEMSEKVGV